MVVPASYQASLLLAGAPAFPPPHHAETSRYQRCPSLESILCIPNLGSYVASLAYSTVTGLQTRLQTLARQPLSSDLESLGLDFPTQRPQQSSRDRLRS